jgi:hypothetical protein
MRLSASGEGGGLFVADMSPGNGAVSSQRIGESVERVAGKTVYLLYASILKSFNDRLRNCLCHGLSGFRVVLVSKKGLVRESEFTFSLITVFFGFEDLIKVSAFGGSCAKRLIFLGWNFEVMIFSSVSAIHNCQDSGFGVV